MSELLQTRDLQLKQEVQTKREALQSVDLVLVLLEQQALPPDQYKLLLYTL